MVRSDKQAFTGKSGFPGDSLVSILLLFYDT